MDLTSLGLTKVAPGESLFENGGAFTGRDRDLIDRLLRLGAKTHRHTAAAPLANPTVAPTLTVSATGGALPSDTPIYATYTALDGDGGESLPAPASNVTTPAGLSTPVAPTAVADYTGGTLVPNTYYYVLTATDDAGGETEAGDPAVVVLEVGHPNARVLLSGLMDAVTAIGGTGWRLYRTVNGGTFGLLAQGATNTFTDDGTPCLDPQVSPPDVSTTGAGGSASITVPAADLPAGAVSYRIYASSAPTFDDPSLLGEFPVADASTAHLLSDLGLQSGAPPAVSTSLGSPAKVLAISEIDWTGWTDPGGGGGAAGPAAIQPPGSVLNSGGGTPAAAEVAKYGTTWEDPAGNVLAALYASYREGALAYVKEVSAAGPVAPYSAADWTGDTAAWTWDGAAGQMVSTGVHDPAVILLPTTGAFDLAADEAYSEFDYSIIAATWTHFGPGLADTTNTALRVSAIIDRAAGTFSIRLADGTVIASIGAADGYTVPAVGDTGYIVLRRVGQFVWAYDGRAPGWTIGGVIPGTASAPGAITVTFLEGGWTAGGELAITYAAGASVPTWFELARVVYGPNGMADHPLASSQGQLPDSWSASVNADGTLARSTAMTNGGPPTVTHAAGSAVYDVAFPGRNFRGVPVVLASGGGVVSAVTTSGFTVTLPAEGAFDVIVQV